MSFAAQFPCFEIVFFIIVIPLQNVNLDFDVTVMGQNFFSLPQFCSLDDGVSNKKALSLIIYFCLVL